VYKHVPVVYSVNQKQNTQAALQQYHGAGTKAKIGDGGGSKYDTATKARRFSKLANGGTLKCMLTIREVHSANFKRS
jgi:hypothetical protein